MNLSVSPNDILQASLLSTSLLAHASTVCNTATERSCPTWLRFRTPLVPLKSTITIFCSVLVTLITLPSDPTGSVDKDSLKYTKLPT